MPSCLICMHVFVKLITTATKRCSPWSRFSTNEPIVVIDCARQNESIKSATVDVRIEFDCKENIPANTTAYCLILHDRVVEYCSLSNVVRKIM